MTYWQSYEYNERYFIRFDDVDGNLWRISIQDPRNEFQVATELTGASIPVEWEGTGNEKQGAVMFGSTGSLRIICKGGQESLFAEGNILPSVINDRRVQVQRYTDGMWATYWQGFIMPDTFSQDWDSAPYEIELPIVSAVAAMEYFMLPKPGEHLYDLFEEQTNIAGLLRAICIASGCDIRYIYTNKPIYEDFNGEEHIIQVPGSDPAEYYSANWTQGVVSSAYYYDITSGIVKPKTFKDVLENICYPYGKVQDCYRGINILMTWKHDANVGARLYYLPIWDDYDNGIISDAVRFRESDPIVNVSLSDLLVEGTDNTFSLISRPRSVTFSKSVDNSKEIFELSERFIKPSLPIGENLLNKPIETVQLNRNTRYLYAIHKDFVNMGFADDWEITNSQNSLKDYCFCRVVEVTGDNDNNSTSVTIPLGLCFNINRVNGVNGAASIRFSPFQGVRTRYEYNVIKLTIKPYIIDEADPAYNKTNMQDTVGMSFSVQDKTTGKYLKHIGSEWAWVSESSSIDMGDLMHESGGQEWTLLFNEDRAYDDNRLHRLNIGFAAATNYALGENTYGRMYVSFKLEYAEYPRATSQSIAAKFAESLGENGNTMEYGGSGEELSIEFSTQAGNKNIVIDGNCMLPFNSFCDAQTYIDTQNREKIEINAAKYEWHLDGINRSDFVNFYAVVTDGDKVFIPVAVGMNPRMNTVRLTLVSTNVTQS